MGVAVPKWLRDWVEQLIERLKPSHHSSGEGSMHIGRVKGKVSHSQTNNHVQVVHNHIYAAPPPAPPPAAAAPPPQPPRQPRPSEMPAHLRRPTSPAHKDLLRLLVDLRPRDRGVFDFMEREFGTRMVIDLDDLQLHRARRYAEAVQSKAPRSVKRGGQTNARRHECH